MNEEEIGVRRVVSLEGDGGGGEGGGGFAGEVGAGMRLVDFEGGSGSGHVFGALPAEVIGGAVADLAPEHIPLRVGLDEVICGPFNGVESIVHLVQICNFLVEIDGSP